MRREKEDYEKWKVKSLDSFKQNQKASFLTRSPVLSYDFPLNAFSLSIYNFVLAMIKERKGLFLCISFSYPLHPCSFIHPPIHPNLVPLVDLHESWMRRFGEPSSPPEAEPHRINGDLFLGIQCGISQPTKQSQLLKNCHTT